MVEKDYQSSRLCTRWCGAIRDGGIVIGSVYLHHSVGVANKSNLDLLHVIAGHVNSLDQPWILGGDWQDTPTALAETGFLQLVDGVVAAPHKPTCNGRTIDFFVVSRVLAHAIHDVRVIGDPGWDAEASAQHTPVRLHLKARPGRTMVRSVASPSPFRATLPHGPPVQPVEVVAPLEVLALEPSAVKLEALSACFTSRLEEELSAVSGHDTKQAKRHAGRCTAPKNQVGSCGSVPHEAKGVNSFVSCLGSGLSLASGFLKNPVAGSPAVH